MRTTKIFSVSAITLAIIWFGGAESSATLVSVDQPFTGTYSENFESFPDYGVQMQPDGNPYLPSGTQIMGGAATMSAQSMIVYDPIRGQPQSGVPGVASFGNLAVADGAHGLALDYAANLTITFANPMRVFGGYFAHDLMYPNYPGGGFNNTPIYVSFLDANGNIVGSTSFDYNHPYFYGAGTGPLDWHGWQSDVAFSSVSFNRQRFAMDGLQASAVPEPSTYIAGALLLLPFGASAMRYLRNRKHNS